MIVAIQCEIARVSKLHAAASLMLAFLLPTRFALHDGFSHGAHVMACTTTDSLEPGDDNYVEDVSSLADTVTEEESARAFLTKGAHAN